MAHFFVTSVRSSDTGLVFDNSLRITPRRSGYPVRYAMQTEFEPILVKQGNLVAPDLALGIYAEIAAPEAGTIGSIAVRLHNADAVGEMVLSVINPQVSYEGFFLYAFIEGILPATQGPSMYRKTEVHNGGYSTLTFGEGKLYALILPPKQAEPFTLPVLADVAISADTI